MRCKHLFENLISAGKIFERFTDDSIQQFSKLVSIVKEKRQEFLHFDHTSESYQLDYFCMNHIGHVKCLEKLFKVLKIIFYTFAWGSLLKRASVLTNPSL